MTDVATDVRPGSALAGVRVLELGEGVSAPFAARLLADLGADVIKVETGTGDPTRSWGAEIEAGRGALFEYLNWNKRSVTLRPEHETEHLLDLVAGAHIVMVGDAPEVLDRWRLTPDTLRARRADLVVVTVTPFGVDGPHRDWRATDLIVQAASGLMTISGSIDREPLKRGLRQTRYTTGLTAAHSALAAYLTAIQHHCGTHIDVAAREVASAELILNAPTYAFMGAIQSRRPTSKDPFSGEPLPCKDGYAAMQTNTWTTLSMFADLLDEPRLKEERFDGRWNRSANGDALTQVLIEALQERTGREVLTEAAVRGLLTGFCQHADQLLSCPQLAERGTLWELPGTNGPLGAWRFPATLGHLSSTPSTVRSAAPRLGEHNGASWDSLPTPAADAASDFAAGPLAGLKVVDLSSVIAAPLIGGMLRDLGADVLRVEPPNRLDQSRGEQFGPIFHNDVTGDWWNRSGSFQSINRGKRSIVLDLKKEQGREILRKLVATADVLLDNYTPRVMRSWGMTYDELRKLNPRLVMLSNTGYGSTGPWSSFKAQGTTLEFTMGAGSYSGYAGEKPTKIGQSYPDFVAAWSGLTALFAALISRDRTGVGQWIDLGMYELGASMIPEAFAAVQAGEPDYEPMGNAEIDTLLSCVVPSEGDDHWLAVAIPDPDAWDAVAAVVTDFPAVAVDTEAAIAALTQWSRDRGALEGAEVLQAAGVPASPVNDARDLLRDPQMIARRYYEPIDFGGDVGVVPVLSRGYRWRGNQWRVGVRGPAPAFGADNDAVLTELGYDPATRQEMRDAGVVVDEPINPPHLPPIDFDVALRTSQYREVDSDYQRVVNEYVARTAT